MAGRATAYVGYSETMHYGIQYVLDNCLPTSGCLDPNEVEVRSFPGMNKARISSGIGWVDALAVDAGLRGEKKRLAVEFIEFMVSEEVYKLILEPDWGKAPSYLLPARKLTNIKNAPLYKQFYPAHHGRKSWNHFGIKL